MIRPWYREPWPWLLMAGPATVLVAGAATTWIAFASSDGLVAEDYYKQGLGINRRLAREEAARKLGISAKLHRAYHRQSQGKYRRLGARRRRGDSAESPAGVGGKA